MKKVLLALAVLSLTACQQMARTHGGSATHMLPKGKHLINVTWKETSLWLLTRDRAANEAPQTYEFSESSSLGIVEGKVTIKEQ